MGGLLAWAFGDLVWAFAPGRDVGSGRTPTKGTAWRLVAIGVAVVFVGAVACGQQASSTSERQDATLTHRGFQTVHRTSGQTVARVETVTVRLEDGTTKDVEVGRLYDAVGTRTDVPVQVDVRPATDSVNAVYYEGRRYGSGSFAAALVVSIVILVVGLLMLTAGVGRVRRLRLAQP